MIVYRVNGSFVTGIGHIKRAIKLAEGMRKYRTIFIVDSLNELTKAFIPKWVNIIEMYSEVGEFKSEHEDADLFIRILSNENEINAVVVDDYRLGKAWEEKVRQALTKNLIVFDDCDEVAHRCAVLIDSRYAGNKTANRYDGKINLECIKLLGPKYFFGVKTDEKEVKNNQKDKSILISLGGGGDLTIVAPTVRTLLNEINSENLSRIYLISGPYSKNAEKIKKEIKDKRLQVIEKSNDITGYLKKSSVYIGSSGTTLYEAISAGCVCLTFSLAKNQKNSKKDLEAFGHYFHINDFDENDVDNFGILSKNFYLNKTRIKKLQENAIVKLDGYGVNRVAKVLTEVIDKNKIDTNQNTNTIAVKKTIDEKKSKNIRRVIDSDVNAYLEARNLEQNAENMTVTEKIREIEHYNWWLTNTRESYVLESNGLPLIFIWHQIVESNGESYLIGGWFVAGMDVTPIDVMSALKFQLNHTEQKYPKITWLAIIKITNKFVKKLNEKYGFKLVNEKKHVDAIEKIFIKVKKEQFNYYYK